MNKASETLAGYFADDLRLMPELQKTVMTKANALAYHRAFIGRFDIDAYTREEIEVLDLGKRVVEFGLFHPEANAQKQPAHLYPERQICRYLGAKRERCAYAYYRGLELQSHDTLYR